MALAAPAYLTTILAITINSKRWEMKAKKRHNELILPGLKMRQKAAPGEHPRAAAHPAAIAGE